VSDVAWSEASYVKVNRIRDSYTWNVQVAARSDSLEDLERAKDKAILVSRDLEDEFGVHP
jgi:hypothetical protein